MIKIIIALMLISTISYGKMFDIGKFSKKLAGKNLDKVTKMVKKSNFTKNLPDIKLPKTLRPEVSTLVLVASKIAKKGDFEGKLIAKTLHPTDVLRQYSKYGDKYLDTMKLFNKKSVGLPISKLKSLKNRFPDMPNVKFKTSQEFNDRFVKALRFTGIKGWKASKKLGKLAIKYPKSSLVAGLMAWYATDPKGFLEKKEKLLDYVESTLKAGVKDVTKLTLGASSGVMDGFIETIKDKATFSNILLLMFAFFLFILWKLRSYIKRFMKAKLEKGVEKVEKKDNHIINYNDNRHNDEEGTKTGNINFVLIGAKSTGKTVYLASLFSNEKSLTSSNPHTMEYLKPLSDSLHEGKYPQPTAGHLYELKFYYEDRKCHIQIDDVDGSFVETMHKEDDETTKKQRGTLIKNIKNSEGIIFFFPYQDISNEDDKEININIKDFNYEIDTVISKLKKMYSKHNHIPIPATIVISKWDRSPDFKANDEDRKVLEYIEKNNFLKLAKDKIEHHFPNLLITPISATGKDITQMEPYNLTKPLKFFIDKTYNFWEKNIDGLKDDKIGLLKYLSRKYFDMKFFKDGIYNKQYSRLEKEFADEILPKFKKIDNYKEFEKLKKDYKDVIPCLIQENISKIEEIDKKLKTKQTIKKVSLGTGIIVTIALIGLGVSGWYIKTKLLKTESELYSDISVEYKNHSYKEAISHIIEYQDKFKDTLDAKHKSSVEKMKSDIIKGYKSKLEKIVKYDSLIKQHVEIQSLYKDSEDANIVEIETKYEEIVNIYDDYKKVLSFSKDDIGELSGILNKLSAYKFKEVSTLKGKFEEKLTSSANNLLMDEGLDNIDSIDNLLGAFTALGINNSQMVQKLLDKKNLVQIDSGFYELTHSIENMNFEDAILKVETDWSEKYSDDKATIIKKILDKKFNYTGQKILKSIPIRISDTDEFNELKNKLKKLENLIENTKISKISYIPQPNSENLSDSDKKVEIYNSYNKVFSDGVSPVKITFGAKKEDNEPLGFKCGDEDEIILTIDRAIYRYNKGDCHDGKKMTWFSNQTFKAGVKYDVTAIEEDTFDDDTYPFWFKLGSDGLIKMENGEYFEIPISNSYFIGFGEE